MNERRLNPVPGWDAALRAQSGILFRFRGIWVLAAAVLTPLAVTVRNRVEMGRANLAFPSFGARYPEGHFPALEASGEAIPIFAQILPYFGIGAIVWALLVWSEEKWGGRDYMWSLPVDRPAHDLWRLVAGAGWLFTVVALVTAIGIVLSLLAREPVLLDSGWTLWLSFLTVPLLVYLVISIPAIASRAPLLWIVGVATAIPFLAGALYASGFYDVEELLVHLIMGGRFYENVFAPYAALFAGYESGLFIWRGDSDLSDASLIYGWLLSIALWLGTASIGVYFAACRKR